MKDGIYVDSAAAVGRSIGQAAALAVEAAGRHGGRVLLAFGGTAVEVRPGDEAQDVIARWRVAHAHSGLPTPQSRLAAPAKTTCQRCFGVPDVDRLCDRCRAAMPKPDEGEIATFRDNPIRGINRYRDRAETESLGAARAMMELAAAGRL